MQHPTVDTVAQEKAMSDVEAPKSFNDFEVNEAGSHRYSIRSL
jgi:hypothetical protein